MLDFHRAQAQLLELAQPLAHVEVALGTARGLVLAADLIAHTPLPRFDASVMDGYAVRAGEIALGMSYPLSGECRAGHAPPVMPNGHVARIFTGAALPTGCDAVVMQENAVRSDHAVVFSHTPVAGEWVRARGCDLQLGQTALAAGHRLDAPAISLAAMLGCVNVHVHRRPSVYIAPTGDELVSLASATTVALNGASIVESNGPAIAAMCTNAGAAVELGPPIADTPAAHREAFSRALAGCDVLVTIGGVSVGDHDYVPSVLADLDVDVAFYKVAMKPGKPLLVGVQRTTGKLVLGLPGNPASALVTFALFGIPLLRKLGGDRAPVAAPTPGTLTHGVTQAPGRLTFLRATFNPVARTYAPLSNQQSGAATSMAHANALMEMPAVSSHLEPGATVLGHRYCDIGF
jgi:molybdopterin molybdotransferase